MTQLTTISPQALRAREQRTKDFNAAALFIIETSCYLSPEGHKHDLCREHAEEILQGYSVEHVPDFWQQFYCHGAAVTCGQCGNLVPPSQYKCECGNRLEERPATLTKPSWVLAVVQRATEDNARLALMHQGYMSTLLFAAGRIIVTQNLLSWGQTDVLRKRLELQKTLQDNLNGFSTQDWHWKWCSSVARFWIEVWPWLEEQGYTIEETDNLSSRQVMSFVALFDKAVKAKVHLPDIADEALAILAAGGDVSIVEIDGEVDKPIYFNDNDLWNDVLVVRSPGDTAWILARVSQEALPIIQQRRTMREVEPEDLLTVMQT